MLRASIPAKIAAEDNEFKLHKQRVKEGIKNSNANDGLRNALDMLGRCRVCLVLKYSWSDHNSAKSYQGSRFLEALLTSNDGCSLVVTQFEVFYKDVTIDDCSNSSPIPKSKRAIKFVVKWKEKAVPGSKPNYMSLIFWTGGLFEYDTNSLELFGNFLSTSSSSPLVDEQYGVVHLPVVPVAFITATRLKDATYGHFS